MTETIMTVRELALFLRMTEKSLYRYVQEGKIPGFKVGGAWRFRRSEIERWIVAQERQYAHSANKAMTTDIDILVNGIDTTKENRRHG